MSVSDFKQPKTKNPQPYTVKVSRQLADHTMIEVVFIEADDARARERMGDIMDAMDDRMIATNERILSSKLHMDALIEAKAKEQAVGLNGGSHADPHRPADVPANP
jgi:hypothetical protein